MKTISFAVLSFTLVIGFNLGAQSYQFQHEAVMEVSMSRNGQPTQGMEYKFLFPDKGQYYGAELSMNGVKAKTIFEMDKMTMITLMDQGGMKMGMQHDLNKTLGMVDAQESDAKADIKKTGNKKDILGYTCEEYVITTDDSYTEVWLTDELKLTNIYTGYAALSKSKGVVKDMPEGFLMQMTSWPKGKDKNEKIEMKAIAINLNQASSISADGYSIMKLN